jgi:hypothetical protein
MSEIGSCSRRYAATVGANIGAIVETASQSAHRVLLLGPLQVVQNGTELPLPPSRKVRALLAYLALAPRPVTRERLCELLWDVADDPRSELRWCLSKLRALIDAPTTTRLVADRERVRIDTNSLDIDAISVARRAQMTLTSGSPRDLQSLRALFRGDFLEGLSVDRAPCSTTGSQANGTALVNCGNISSSGSAPCCRRIAMIVWTCCGSASKSSRSTKQLTSSSFARCFAAGFMPKPSIRSMRR